jgi:hypothetical protein
VEVIRMIGYIPTIPDPPVGEWNPLGALVTLGLLVAVGIFYLIRAGSRPGTRH